MIRSLCAGWVALLGLSGCGGRSPAPAAPRVAGPAPDSLMVLYGDAVEVRVAVRIDGAGDKAGAARAVDQLPPGDRYTVRARRGVPGAARGVRVVGPPPRASFAGLIGARVTARGTDGAEHTGPISAIHEASIAVLDADNPTQIALPAEIEVDAPADIPAAVELRARGARGELEVSSWLGQVAWQIGYTAVVDGGRGEIQGWLSLANNTGHPIVAERIAASLAAAELGGPTAALLLPGAVDLGAGDSIELPLFEAPRVAPASIVCVFDPVGDRLDHEGRRPVSRSSYGARIADGPSPASVALEIKLDRLGRLPGGRIAVYERRGGALIPVGDGLGFADPAQSSAALELGQGSLSDSGIGRVVVAQSAEIIGRRWQEDFHYDPEQRRLVEEIRVELENTGDRRIRVDVREHQYRGLNWAVVYHNEAGPLTKTASQEIRFDVDVAPRSKRLVVYRVAYTW